MRPDMIQSVIRATFSPVVGPSELFYMLLGCLDELFQLFGFIVGLGELPAHLCLYLHGRGQAWRTGGRGYSQRKPERRGAQAKQPDVYLVHPVLPIRKLGTIECHSG